MINKALGMMEDFIDGRYEPLDFSYNFPDFLIQNYDRLEQENEYINGVLNENMPEICAEYEIGEPPDDFIKQVKDLYYKITATI